MVAWQGSQTTRVCRRRFALVLGPVAADDRVVRLVHQLGPTLGFAPRLVAGAFGPDHIGGHTQADVADRRTATFDDPSVVVCDADVVAEEPRRTGAGVGDQRL